MKLSWVAAAAAFVCGQAVAQDQSAGEPASDHWETKEDNVLSKPSDISIPYRAGSLELVAIQGKTFDESAQYRSDDGKIMGTVYLYRASLPDVGLAFLATDAAIAGRSGAGLELLDDRLVSLGGLTSRARRASYGKFEESEWHSTAAFVEAGAWVAKLRVSGPADRVEEIEAAMDALLAGLEFGEGSQPLPARKLVIEECLGSMSDEEVRPLKPTIDEGLLYGTLEAEKIMDEGEAPIGFNMMMGRVPSRLCVADRSVVNENVAVITLKALPNALAEDGDDFGLEPRAFMLVGDAGLIAEVTSFKDDPDRIFIVRHGIGSSRAYGAFPKMPGLEQIRAIAYDGDAMASLTKVTPNEKGGMTINIDCGLTVEGCDDDDADE